MKQETRTEESVVPVESIGQVIMVMRGQRVIIDSDLARLYGVTTTRLNQQVRRNVERFPEDFMFQLTKEEYESLMLQIATSKNKPDWEGNEPSRSQNIVPRSGRGGRRKLPLAFTEHGALMAASVLNTPRAVDMRVYFVRAFVLLSRTIANHPELTQKLEELERLVDRHDEHIAQILETIRQLMAPQPVSERRIGFGTQQN